MTAQISFGDLTLDVVLKDIKNVHLSVHPPTGRVRISAPMRMSMDTIRVFAVSKIDWIRQQQTKLRNQERESPREYIDRESHYLWGKRYLLAVSEIGEPPTLQIENEHIHLRVRPGTGESKREALVAEWYRRQVKDALPLLLARWQPRLGLNIERYFVQQMKTKWGSYSRKTRSIRLNTELAKKPVECLEYIVVHELVHLLEPTHNARFVALMDRFMPEWKFHRELLNRLPVRGETWSY